MTIARTSLADEAPSPVAVGLGTNAVAYACQTKGHPGFAGADHSLHPPEDDSSPDTSRNCP
jgi:hypothetical protein